jgi:predicted dehydrogenase
VAVSDADGRKATELATRHRIHVDREWRTLIARSDIDAVIVATPPIVHREMTVHALEEGKHVLCEKPLARDPDEARTMVEAAQRADRFLATGFNYRFYPSFARARALLDAGAIGSLSHIRAYGGYSATSHAQAWVHDAEVVGGGALHDIGIHLLDLTRWYMGEVEEACGFASNGIWQYPGCEDNGCAVLRGPEGRLATVHASWTEWERYRFAIELVGPVGRILATCFPMRVELLRTGRVGERMRRTTERFPVTFAGEHVRSYRWVVTRSFVHELDAFARAARGEASPIASGNDGLRTLEIAHGISRRASARVPVRGDA